MTVPDDSWKCYGNLKQYCKQDDPNESLEPAGSDECADSPPPTTECAPGTAESSKTSMTCKIPKCTIDGLNRDEWPGIGFGQPPPLPAAKSTAAFVQTRAAAAADAPAAVVAPGGAQGAADQSQCVCVGAVNQQGANAGRESVDSPDFNPDGSMTVPGPEWKCYNNLKQYCTADDPSAFV